MATGANEQAMSPPSDLALLRDGCAHEERVLDESAAHNLRQALQILKSPAGTLGTFKRGARCFVFTAEEIAMIDARIRNALDILESPSVLRPESIALFVDDLAGQGSV
jgi:hypothetical protein